MILREIKNIFIKNRLTEGVDFVRKEWLKGDGRAYIDTKVTDLSISNYIKFIFDDSGNIGVRARTWGREGNRLVVGNDGNTSVCIIWGASSSSTIWYHNNGIYVYDMYFDLLNNKVIINNQTYSIALPHGNGVSFLLFARHGYDNAVDYINWSKYKSFEVHNQINLVPCQLLKSIPATLDANNIARTAGECGMYDSISGKFFGNVANSGTFTVEGDVEPETHSGLQQIYQNKLIEGVDYETADWLRYIDWVKPKNDNISLYGAKLNCELRVTTRLQLTIKIGEIINNINNSEIELVVSSSTKTYYIRCAYSDNNIAVYSPSSNRISDKYYLDSELNFIITEEGLFVNDIHLINEKIEYISQFGHEKRSCRGSISSITTEEGVDVLVPCTLLRSIPRNLDAQCKERVAGECGMINLETGQFHGNVASSGTFTVENDTENNE